MRANSQPVSHKRKKRRLLVADDDPRLLDLMTVNLEDDFTEVVCAKDGAIARDMLTLDDFNLAIIDLGMPGLDGFELIAQLRQHPRTVDLPIIVVTGRDDKQAIEQAFSIGASTFVTKPVNWTLFRYQVKFIIRSGRIKKDLRLARDKADKASRAKNNLIQLLSHELRSPLNILVGFAEVLQRDLQDSLDPQHEAHLSDISNAGQRLSEVFSDVLFYSRLQDGNHQLNSGNTSLDELIEDAAVSLQGRAAAKGIELYHFDYTGNRELCGERNLLLDALRRLTDNAVKFSPEGSEVELTASLLKDSSVVISVKDKGPGIAMHKLERCMKPFEQADEALTRTEQGLGLGLAISKKIAELHGGKLIVDTQPGKGTTASLWMPASSLVVKTARKAG